MNLWYLLALIYPWTVLAALLVLVAPSERRGLAVNALLWPVLIPWAFLSDPVGYFFDVLRWWPQQGRLIATTEAVLSAYPDRRLAQVESRLRHTKKFGTFMLRRYYGWLQAERSRLAGPTSTKEQA